MSVCAPWLSVPVGVCLEVKNVCEFVWFCDNQENCKLMHGYVHVQPTGILRAVSSKSISVRTRKTVNCCV